MTKTTATQKFFCDAPVCFSTVPECANCQTTDGPLDRISTDDGNILLCEDCAVEQRRVEEQAYQLTSMPSCESRQSLIDQAQTVGGLVNALRAHDLAQCALCASTRKTVASDRLHVDTAAVCCEGKVA